MKRYLDERLCLFMKGHQHEYLYKHHSYCNIINDLIIHIIYYFSFHGVSALFALGICVRNDFVISVVSEPRFWSWPLGHTAYQTLSDRALCYLHIFRVSLNLLSLTN